MISSSTRHICNSEMGTWSVCSTACPPSLCCPQTRPVLPATPHVTNHFVMDVFQAVLLHGSNVWKTNQNTNSSSWLWRPPVHLFLPHLFPCPFPFFPPFFQCWLFYGWLRITTMTTDPCRWVFLVVTVQTESRQTQTHACLPPAWWALLRLVSSSCLFTLFSSRGGKWNTAQSKY